MRVVIAPQALKGSLTAKEAGMAIAKGVANVFLHAQVDIIPIADGGEGTVQALVDATEGELIWQEVTGPLGEPVQAYWGLMGDGRTAVIEMAASSGLPLVPHELRDPRITTTYGVGELISAALDRGCRHFIIGLGGSATNDGGAGMAQALGASLMDAGGEQIAPGGAVLLSLAHIAVEHLDARLHECTFDVACDVTNPLCGPLGASAIYGPQKGATPAMVEELDHALVHYAEVIQRDVQMAVADIPGAGAAGGLGAGTITFLRGNLRPGAQIVNEALRVAERIAQADLVITAEGQLDVQTAYGKSVGAVAEIARAHAIPTLALAGSLGENYQAVYALGIAAVAVLPSGPMTLTYAMQNAADLLMDATERTCRAIKLGIDMRPT